MAGAFGGDGQAVKLAGKADGEIADVDHFLHFAEAFRGHLADFDRDQLAEFSLMGAQLFTEQADQFAALRGRDDTPVEEGLVRRVDGLGGIGGRGLDHVSNAITGDG